MSDRMGTTELRVLQEIRDLLGPVNQEHQHQFVIPVEWEYQAEYENDPGNLVASIRIWAQTRSKYAERKIVIKLRCACGEETDR